MCLGASADFARQAKQLTGVGVQQTRWLREGGALRVHCSRANAGFVGPVEATRPPGEMKGTPVREQLSPRQRGFRAQGKVTDAVRTERAP